MRLNVISRSKVLCEQDIAATGSTAATPTPTAAGSSGAAEPGPTTDIGLDIPSEPLPDFDADRANPKPEVQTDDSLIIEPVIWTRIRSRLKSRGLIDHRARNRYPVQLDEDSMTEEQLLMNAVGIIEALPDSIRARYRRRKPRVPGPVLPTPERQVVLGRKSRPTRINETDIDVSATSGLGGLGGFTAVSDPDNLGAYSSLYTPGIQDTNPGLQDLDEPYPVPDDQAEPEPEVIDNTTSLADVINHVGSTITSVGRLLGSNKDTIAHEYADTSSSTRSTDVEPDIDTADLPRRRDIGSGSAEFSVDEDDLPPTEAYIEPPWLATIAETVGPLA